MAIVPNRVQDLLEFASMHAERWQSVATQIGLTSAQALAFSNAVKTAQDDYNAAASADMVKLAATNTSQNSVRALRRSAAETLALIKAYAENQANPNAVYDAAQIPPPATPSPAPAPGTPYKFAVTLEDSGAITLKFKCDNPAGTTGTIYEVRRKIGGGAMAFIGASGVKSFTDETLPSSSASGGVTYQITAVRSTARGQSASFNVNFGVGGDGMLFAQVSEHAGTMKMAA